MKKALAMALGAVLVAGTAAPASATDIDISGLYRTQFHTIGNLGYTGQNNVNDTFFSHRFQLDMNFQATESVGVHFRLQAPNGQRWGNNTTNGSNMLVRYVYGQVDQDWGTVRIGKLPNTYGDKFGLAHLGWGGGMVPNFTGASPFDGGDEFTGVHYTNTWDNGFTLNASYIKIDSEWKNGGRQANTGANTDPTNPTNHSSEHDHDRYQVEGVYKWDGGGAAMNVFYERDAGGQNAGGRWKTNNSGFDGDSLAWTGTPDTLTQAQLMGRIDKLSVWYLNPAIMHSWGAFSVRAEGKFGFGEIKFYNNNNDNDVTNDLKDVDANGQAFYMDFDYNYGPGNVNLAGWWVSGNDVDDTDHNAVVPMGNDFVPLAVAYANRWLQTGASSDERNQALNAGAPGAATIANDGLYFTSRALRDANNLTHDPILNRTAAIAAGADVPVGTDPRAILTRMETFNGVDINPDVAGPNNFYDFTRRTRFTNGDANHWALMLSGKHGITDEITLHYALGYLQLNNPNYRIMDSLSFAANDIKRISFHEQDEDLGWEVDLGVSVKLLDNLTFSSTAGYMFTGDAYKSIKGYNASVDAGVTTLEAEWEDADNAYSWLNALVFTF